MAKINLICEQCGGNIILDQSQELGTCEHCFAQYVIKQDQIIQNITKYITKHVYGVEGKDIEELLEDGYELIALKDYAKANAKFYKAINLQPNSWNAWLGYAATGGNRNRTGYNAITSAYQKAYALAKEKKQKMDTYFDMLSYLPDTHLREAFARRFIVASQSEHNKIFNLVSNVIGCDESEIASLALDLCPEDWRAHFAMAKFRKIRVRWCDLEGGFFSGKRLPEHANKVLDVFLSAYRLAKGEGEEPTKVVVSYINEMAQDSGYKVFANELIKKIQLE